MMLSVFLMMLIYKVDNCQCHLNVRTRLLLDFAISFLKYLLNCCYGPNKMQMKSNASIFYEVMDYQLVHCNFA